MKISIDKQVTSTANTAGLLLLSFLIEGIANFQLEVGEIKV